MTDGMKLVVDVGMHLGNDTERYLQQGYRVVGVEANPVLAAEAQRRFAGEIEADRLLVLPVAVARRTGTASLTIFGEQDGWSTMSAARTEVARARGYAGKPVTVVARRFSDILDAVGTPYYLKVDIEGSDMLCVEALRGRTQIPEFLSIESAVSAPGASFAAVVRELWALYRLGYWRFTYVDQSQGDGNTSGGFGDEVSGWQTLPKALRHGLWLRVKWHVFGNTGSRWCRWRFKRADAAGRHLDIRWYDVHARRV